MNMPTVYELDNLTDLSPSMKGALVRCVVDFVQRSKTPYGVQAVYEYMLIGLRQHAASVIIVLQDEELRGFAVFERVNDFLGGQCFIRAAYAKNPEVMKAGYAAIRAWAVENKCRTINFITMRNPKVYERLLRRHGFKQKNVEFEVTL